MTTDAPPTSQPLTVSAEAAPADAADEAARAEAAATAAEDLRLARLHLRLGMIGPARAELEDLGRREALGLGGLAALAEARWRGGDLDGAAEAAIAHLDRSGDDLVAIVVAAEAAAAAGRPTEARELVDRAGSLDAVTLDALFAGLPRRAYWPSAAPAATAVVDRLDARPADAMPAAGGRRATGAEVGAAAIGRPDVDRDAGRAIPGPGEVLAANAGLWDAAGGLVEAGSATVAEAPSRPPTPASWVEPAREKAHADPEAELETAREELADAPDRGLLRLALVLRLDPTLAPDVLESVRLRREPAALVIRGDAQRLLGRFLEAEAEFAEAAETIEREAIARSRRGGRHPTPEES